MQIKKDQVIKDFQEWALERGYEWSGAADVWLASYDHYFKENNDLKEIVKKYNQLVLINYDLRAQIADMKHLMDFIEGKTL